MRTETIPNAIHLCPGCGDLVSGETYCAPCRRKSMLRSQRPHASRRIADKTDPYEAADRADAMFSQLPRETGRMPEEGWYWWRPLAMLSVLVGPLLLFALGVICAEHALEYLWKAFLG